MVIQSLTISKKRKEMKKIFYILAAAIVALGTVACENEGLDNINPNINVDGDTVSFVAGINRTGLDGTATVWDADDIIVVTWNGNNYEFKNAETGDKNTFKCTAEGLSAIVDAENIKAVYSNNKDGNVDSAAGVAGALLVYEGAFGEIAFEVKNAFLKFTVADPVTLTASEGLFGGDLTELTFEEAGVHYVAVNAGVAATLEYKVGESMGKKLETTFEAKKIYNLGNLTKSIASDSNGKYYTELATAFKLAESGATITLLEDIALEGLTEGALMKVDKNLTLNVGEHTLTATLPTATKNASIFTVTKGAEFTLVGAGNIVIENCGGSNIGNHFISNEGGIVNLEMDGGIELNVVGTPFINCIVDNNSTVGAATLNVKKGTYKQNSGNIFRSFVNHKTELATINISGGSIIGTGEKAIYIWNQKMGKTTGILNITAGTFVNVQIDNDDKTLNQVTFTAEGYTLQQNANGYYDVVEWNPVASVGGVEYESFEAALTAAEAGSTIELLANVESTEAIAKECVVEAGEFTFTPTLHEDYKMSKEGTTYTIKARVYVAQVGTTKYESFAEAYAAGTEITLLANVGNVNILKACVINAGEYNINITPGEGYGIMESSNNTYRIAKLSEWEISDGTRFYETETADLFVIKNVKLTANNFCLHKVGDTGWGAGAKYGLVNAGTKQVDTAIGVYSANWAGDITISNANTVAHDIYFDKANSRLYVLTVGKTPANITAPTSTTSYNIAGTMNSWGSGTKFNYAGDNVWHLVIELALNAEFKVQKNGSWNDGENWGYTGIQSGVGKSLFSNQNGNAKAKAKATYEIWVIPSHSDAPLYIIKK